MIYVADDEDNIRNVVAAFLSSEGYSVRAFATGEELLAAYAERPCDLVILDVMMPGLSGLEVCTEIRKVSSVPIIMLTARDSDIDYATGINLGSDDYFTKPFSAIPLLMRVRAIFRRIELDRMEYERAGTDRSSARRLRFGDLDMDQSAKTVTVGAEELELTPNEFNLLGYLLQNQDRAVSRAELLERVWGYETEVETRAPDDTVRRLRRKLAASGTTIDTVWGFGFRLKKREREV